MRSRPVVVELEAISRSLLLAEETGRSHAVHVSTGRRVGLVVRPRQRGTDATCETCPQYLVMTEEDQEKLGATAKCAPPLRPRDEREASWRYLAPGTLPTVSSDHSPAPPETKIADNFFDVWGGISGGQSTLGLMLTAGNVERGVPLTRLAAVCSEDAASRFGLPGEDRAWRGRRPRSGGHRTGAGPRSRIPPTGTGRAPKWGAF